MDSKQHTRRQLKIEALGRLVAHADMQAENLDGFRNDLAREMRNIRVQLRNRQRKLEVREEKGGSDEN